MKNLKVIFAASACALAIISSPSFSADETTPPTLSTKADGKGAVVGKVAYVDLVKIVNESKAAQGIEKQIDKLKNKYQADAKLKETAIKSREKELADQQKAISKEAFEKKVIEFRKRIQSDQAQIARYQKILQTAYVKALEALKVQTVKIAGEYAKENNISLVLPKAQLLYGYDAYDITDDVLKMIDDKVPEINISVDEKVEKGEKGAEESKDSKKKK